MSEKQSRRTFLAQMGSIALGVTLMPLAACEFNKVTPLVRGAEVPFLTPVKDFFSQNGADGNVKDWKQPNLKADEWELSIEGDAALVKNPLKIKLSDLEKEKDKEISILKTIRCVFDFNEIPGLISTGVWTGIPLKLFLDRAQIDTSKAKRIRLFGYDGFRNNIKISDLYKQFDADHFEPLLVTKLNGESLPAKHGFPVRLIMHESYGYKNVKWLQKLEVTADDTPFGIYQDNGFVDDGVIRIVSKATAPTQNVEIDEPGEVKILGFAVSGFAGVEKVEISIDKGPFKEARLAPLDRYLNGDDAELLKTTEQFKDTKTHSYPFRGVWVQWELDWQATPGDHEIRIKATDGKGNTQEEKDSNLQDGNNSIPTIKVKVKDPKAAS